MTANGWIQIAVFTAILIALARPLGGYMTAVFEGRIGFLRPVERGIYALCGVDEREEQHWLTYGIGMLLTQIVGFLLLYGLQRVQYYLPFNPQEQAGICPRLTAPTFKLTPDAACLIDIALGGQIVASKGFVRRKSGILTPA